MARRKILLFPNESADSPGEKRQKIALRMLKRGYRSDIALELTPEGLAELERRLDRIELREEKDAKLSQRNWISWLVSRRTRHLPLRYDDLPKDQARVTKLKIERLEKQLQALCTEFYEIKSQIEVIMAYSDSENQLANLEEARARVEKELRQKEEELARLNDEWQRRRDSGQSNA